MIYLVDYEGFRPAIFAPGEYDFTVRDISRAALDRALDNQPWTSAVCSPRAADTFSRVLRRAVAEAPAAAIRGRITPADTVIVGQSVNHRLTWRQVTFSRVLRD